MNHMTSVSVYEVDSKGATGFQIGTGVLVDPLLVLVNKPLSRALASTGSDARVRLGISSSADTGDIIEVIDGRGVHIAEFADGEPIVAISLAQSSSCVPSKLDVGTATSKQVLLNAMDAHLSNETVASNEPVASATHGDALGREDYRRIFCFFDPPPWWCHEVKDPDSALDSEQ